MDWVFPGTELVLAMDLELQMEFISDDFPTFDLPEKTNSGRWDSGNSFALNTVLNNLADIIFIDKKRRLEGRPVLKFPVE
jgi:hypothetical protein